MSKNWRTVLIIILLFVGAFGFNRAGSERTKRVELEERLRYSDSVLYDCRQGRGVLSRRIAELFAYDTCVTLTDVGVVADYVWRVDCEKIGGLSSSDSVWCFRCTQPNKKE